jgi:hypothetical protein
MEGFAVIVTTASILVVYCPVSHAHYDEALGMSRNLKGI